MAQDTTYKLVIPKGYKSKLDVLETEKAIKLLKDFFETKLAEKLNLVRVSAPMFLSSTTGLNDNLNGVERPVSFDIKEQGGEIAEVVQSLAKWKRYALKKYGLPVGQGLYTDMNAIRRDEITDNLHSIYVDQWDWEKVITKQDRTIDFLKSVVKDIYSVILETKSYIQSVYPFLDYALPEEITFITTQELEEMYPDLAPAKRESEFIKKHGAVFFMQIGGKLKSGIQHDGRAPDYDDWTLNGDIVLYSKIFDRALEVSSMGIRVDEKSLATQLKEAGAEDRTSLPFQKALLAGELPLSIGGGIGQSRMCMFFLDKAHVGEVQASIWPKDMIAECENAGISLL